MNKQRKVLITTTYNEMGIIIDTKAEEVAQPEKRTNERAETHGVCLDAISRQQAIDICRAPHMRNADCSDFEMAIMMLPPAQPVIVPCDYAKACNKVAMNRIASAVVYMEILEDFKEYGYVLVDMREVTE